MHRVRRPSLLRLVAVLVAVAGACDGQESAQREQPGQPGHQPGHQGKQDEQHEQRAPGQQDQLEATVGQIAAAVTSSVLKQLDSRLKQFEYRLHRQNALLRGIQFALAKQDPKPKTIFSEDLDKVATQVNQLSSNVSLISQAILSGKYSEKLETPVNQPGSNVSRIWRKTFPRDCSDLPALDGSCTYELQPGPGDSQPPTSAYCDQDTDGGGWTVIQRRNAHIKPRENFNPDWASYRKGFGSLTGEFWWGLQNLWMLTWSPDRNYELRVDMEDFDGQTRYAVYDSLRITSECDGYRLILGNYTGTGDAGDSLNRSNGTKFTTKDRDNDEYRLNCSRYRKGGFWFNKYCNNTNLNGEHYSGPRKNTWEDKAVVTWLTFRGPYHSLKIVEMKVRPTYK